MCSKFHRKNCTLKCNFNDQLHFKSPDQCARLLLANVCHNANVPLEQASHMVTSQFFLNTGRWASDVC